MKEEKDVKVEKEIDKESSAPIEKIKKCGCCLFYRDNSRNMMGGGLCLRHRDSDGEYAFVKSDENYCEEFRPLEEKDEKDEKEK